MYAYNETPHVELMLSDTKLKQRYWSGIEFVAEEQMMWYRKEISVFLKSKAGENV